MPYSNKIRIDYLHDQQVLGLILNAPKGNVLDMEMIKDLTAALRNEARGPKIKAIVFKGEGEHFSFGASVSEHRKALVGEMLVTFHDLFRVLIETSKPTFALVRGQCLGGGLELAAFCNWIFASEDATFGQPEIQLAVFAPVASLILPVKVGQTAAEHLLLTGQSISAQTAHQLGLVHLVSDDPENDLVAFVSEHILPKSAAALHYAVKAARHEMHQGFLRNIDEVERLYVKELMATHDANEGILAFMEKRRPVWRHE